jgi:hypothetical protein
MSDAFQQDSFGRTDKMHIFLTFACKDDSGSNSVNRSTPMAHPAPLAQPVALPRNSIITCFTNPSYLETQINKNIHNAKSPTFLQPKLLLAELPTLLRDEQTQTQCPDNSPTHEPIREFPQTARQHLSTHSSPNSNT